MSAANEQLLERWFDEVWRQGREECIDELFAEDGVAYGLAEHGWNAMGPAAYKEFSRAFRSAFSDLHIAIEDVVATGDKVAARLRVTGMHTGELLGIAPTGKRVDFAGMTIVHIAGGKIQQGWNVWDQLGLLTQLDAAPGAPKIAMSKKT